jgi:hypothetical protein
MSDYETFEQMLDRKTKEEEVERKHRIENSRSHHDIVDMYELNSMSLQTEVKLFMNVISEKLLVEKYLHHQKNKKLEII